MHPGLKCGVSEKVILKRQSSFVFRQEVRCRRIIKMAMLHLSDQNFKKEVLESSLPVIVDFWATWCNPCKAIAPIIEELSKEYSSKIKIGKINVEDNPKPTTAYGVMSIPTLILFKDGRVLSQYTGALSKAQLKKKIEEELL